MKSESYNKFILKIVAICLVFSAVFGFVVYNRGPHIRLVEFDKDIQSTSLTNNLNLTLHFDRPIVDADYSEFIEIQPKTEFSTTTKEQSIVVTFRQSLKANSTYNISVEPKIADTSGKLMKSKYSHSFKSGPARYLYLKRNYEIDSKTNEKQHDQIVQKTVGTNGEKVVFSAPRIERFVANSNYIVAITDGQKNQNMHSIDLSNGKTTEHELYLVEKISNLTLSESGKTVLFTTSPDIESVSRKYYQDNSNILYALDIDSNNLRPLTDENDNIIKATDVVVASEGQVAMVQYQNGDYYAVSPFNDYSPILLGSHSGAFGFNEDGNEVAFFSRGSVSTYDIANSELSTQQIPDAQYLKDVKYSSSNIFVGYTVSNIDVESEIYKSDSKINLLNDWSSEPYTAWQEPPKNEQYMIEFEPSYGSDYLAIQLSPEVCNIDDYINNGQCKETMSIIHDNNSNQTVETVAGFNVVWLP